MNGWGDLVLGTCALLVLCAACALGVWIVVEVVFGP